MADLALVQERLGALGREYSAADVAAVLRGLGEVVTDASVLGVMERLRRNSFGAGPLEDLLRRPGVSDVVVNGPRAVFVDQGRGLERADVTFVDDDQVRRLAIRLAAAAGRRLDDAQPFVDGRLADGTRLHAVLAPVAMPGTCLSLRVPASRTFSLDDLVGVGAVPERGALLLREMVLRKVPFLVTGGTGSGKTTLLAALLAEVPHHERIVLVEDARELVPNHPHCVRLEGRPANAEGTGGIPLAELVRQALRMRPDRVVLGEVRGAEITDLLRALNTGHEGGCATVHANSVSDVPTRLEALAALGGLSRDACHAQVASALRLVVHVQRRSDGARRIEDVGVVVRGGDDRVRILPGLRFSPDGVHRMEGAEAVEELLC